MLLIALTDATASSTRRPHDRLPPTPTPTPTTTTATAITTTATTTSADTAVLAKQDAQHDHDHYYDHDHRHDSHCTQQTLGERKGRAHNMLNGTSSPMDPSKGP